MKTNEEYEALIKDIKENPTTEYVPVPDAVKLKIKMLVLQDKMKDLEFEFSQFESTNKSNLAYA
jgi:hypothetical protein